jgi:hypothetical protein
MIKLTAYLQYIVRNSPGMKLRIRTSQLIAIMQLQINLALITILAAAVNYQDPLCEDPVHCDALNKYVCDITASCTAAASDLIPLTGRSNGFRVIPGWTEHVEPSRSESVSWHIIWVQSDRPRLGTVADIKRRTGANYHRNVRRASQCETR